MQFIKSKFPNVDEVQFASEALEFVPKKKVMKEVPSDERCIATKKDGERCTKRCANVSDRCIIHEKAFLHNHVDPQAHLEKVEKVQCSANTKKGDQCKKKAIDNGLCSIHCQSPVSLETVSPVLVC